MRWCIVALVIGLALVVGCSMSGTRAAQEDASAELVALRKELGTAKAHQERASEEWLSAKVTGDPRAAELEALKGDLTAHVESLKTSIAAKQSQVQEISIEERRQRVDDAKGWAQVAMGVFSMIAAGGAFGAAKS